MTNVSARKLACGVVILWALCLQTSVAAQWGVGTWVKQPTASSRAGLTMTVEACCSGGRRLTYRLTGGDLVMIVESAFDGKDAPVMIGGKPSGETMAIKRIDDHHVDTVIKMNGTPFGTAKGTLSADGKTLTNEVAYTAAVAGQTVGKQTEIWVRK